MTFKNLKVEDVGNGVSVIRIDRPKVLNALNSETLLELKVALEAAAVSEKVRVLILTGAGEKAFIAGADISEMASLKTSEGIRFAQLGHEVTKLLELMPKPTVAAVNGFALGGGTEFAISCDFVIASDTAVFGQPEVGLGIIPGFGGTLRLMKFVGLPRAKEMIFSGRKVKAEEALSFGLVNRVVSQKEFWDEVMSLAKQMSANARGAVGASKRLMNEFAESRGLDYKLDSEAQEFGGLFGSNDQVEGMKAFLEKRKPKFEGIRGDNK